MKPVNKQLQNTPDDYALINSKLDQLRDEYPETGRLITTNQLTLKHKEYLKHFGHIINMTKIDAVKHVNAVLETVVTGYNLNMVTKGLSLKEMK